MTTIILLSLIATGQPSQAPPLRAAPPQAPALRETRTDAVDPYAAFLQRVREGAEGRVYVGRDVPRGETNAIRRETFDGQTEGVYRCFLHAGEPSYERVLDLSVTTVKGHQHTCPKCKTTWQHPDNDPSASHVCPNEKCQTVVTKKSGSVLIPVETKPAKPKRISLNGRWYDQYPDGRLVECVT